MQQLKLSDTGIQDFFWPINNNDTETVIDYLINETVAFFRASSSKKSRETILLTVANSYFLRKILSVYYVKLSEASLAKESHLNFADAFLSEKNNLLSQDQYLEHLKRGLRDRVKSTPGFYGFAADWLKTIIRNDGFTRRNIAYTLNADAIISTGGGDAAIRYLQGMQGTQRKAYMVKIGDFYPSSIQDFNLSRNVQAMKETDIYCKYIILVEEFFQSYNIALSEKEFTELVNWLDSFLAYTSEYLRMLEENQCNIPKILWISSAGILWNRLLSIKVRDTGGSVVVFDHANGSNLDSKTFMPFVEFQDLDIFVTFSSVQKRYLEERLDDQIYNLSSKPQIVVLDNIK